jgi:D-alanyl-D-alanine carboxypeptidase/D-alanyl-D-alanine-endopeptidase (penicillin-binding protein 4)
VPLGRTWQIAGSAAIGLVVAAGAVAAAGPWESGQRTAERSYAAARDGHGRPAPHTAPRPTGTAGVPVPESSQAPAAPVLAPVDAAAPPTAAALTSRLDPLMSGHGLGQVSTGAVLDARTGTVLYDRKDGAATTPASATKLATAVAALGMLGPGYRLTTSVVEKGHGQVVLVGGGDPTLELGQLADDTAAALKSAGTRAVSLAYDTSLYSGPTLHPIGYNDNLAPVTALMADEGRQNPTTSGPAPRWYDPAAAAAGSFAQLLAGRGITVTGTPGPGSGKGGGTLATHRSAPLSDLVERMLTNSDNDIAEALARQVARAAGQPVSFAGGAKAIRTALTRYGVPLPGASFHDGSGLDHDDRLSPLTLARLLALAADARHPELRSVITGIPVADFTGTLSARFQGSPAAGVVHAKTGTLTGTNTIAGTVVTRSGRLLSFAFMTQGADAAASAETALDHLAAAVAAS